MDGTEMDMLLMERGELHLGCDQSCDGEQSEGAEGELIKGRGRRMRMRMERCAERHGDGHCLSSCVWDCSNSNSSWRAPAKSLVQYV